MGIVPFIKPDRVIMHKETDFFGLFEFRPLEKGYGVTIGNAMRRILLSSLEGYAIISLRMPKVDHEFSTIKGVVEDVTEIILNLKQVRFKSRMELGGAEKIFISIKGQDKMTAGDIGKHTNSFDILNPDLVICNMDPALTVEMEIQVAKGRGYLSAEDNKPENAPIGYIAMDSIFTPIKNVKYSVEDYRVEQKTDFEKLVLEVTTDGSIHPENALKEAAKLLIHHFMLFSDENMTLDVPKRIEAPEVDEQFMQTRKILKTPLSDLDLSVRAYNCLKAAEIRTLADLVKYDIADLLKFRNFGKKSLTELEELVREKGLTFGMDIYKYKIDQD